MKTDIIFYELIKELPQIFFELIGKPTTNPNTYEFTAPELKQQAFRLDGLFSPLPGLKKNLYTLSSYKLTKMKNFMNGFLERYFFTFVKLVPHNENGMELSSMTAALMKFYHTRATKT